MDNPTIKRLVLILLITTVPTLIGCDKQQDEKSRQSGQGKQSCEISQEREPGEIVKIDSGQMILMGTFGRIQIRCCREEQGRQALAAALGALEEIDRLLSTYRGDSELSEVNRDAGEKPVRVSLETYNLLEIALKYSRKTGGAFDITVAPLLKVWQEAEKQNRLPAVDELTKAEELVGFEKLRLSAPKERTVSFAEEGMELNVNAIAKGYAVDRVLTALRQPDVAAAMVDIGGEIACFGQNEPGKDWLVGVQDPFARSNDNPFIVKPRWKIRLRNCAVATSGDYRQYTTIKGEKYSHIIDPRAGKPTRKLPSVTIISERSVDADALATAVSVLGPKEGMKLIELLPNTEALLIGGTREKPQIYRSTGFNKYEIGD